MSSQPDAWRAREVEHQRDDPDMAVSKTDLLEQMTDRMAESIDPLPERPAAW